MRAGEGSWIGALGSGFGVWVWVWVWVYGVSDGQGGCDEFYAGDEKGRAEREGD